MYIGYCFDRLKLGHIEIKDNSVEFKTKNNLTKQIYLPYLIIKIILVITFNINSQGTTAFKPINPQFYRPRQMEPLVRVRPKLQNTPGNLGQGGKRSKRGGRSKSYRSMDKTSKQLSADYVEYQNDYRSEFLEKRFDTTRCPTNKFKRLAQDPRTTSDTYEYTRTSIDEARGVIQAEMENLIIRPTRPNKITAQEVDLDYQVLNTSTFYTC
jgi:hypothetical protein